MSTLGNIESNLFGLLGPDRSTGYRHLAPEPSLFQKEMLGSL